MKKFLCLLLSLVLVFSLFTACGEDKKSEEEKEDTSASDAADNDSEEAGDSSEAEKEVNIFKDKLAVTDKLMSAVDDAQSGSVSTVKFGIALESADDITDGNENVADVLSYFGCTGNKIELTAEMSVLSTADDKGKITLSILGGNAKKIMSLDVIAIGEDIYVDVEQVIDSIEDIGAIAGASEDKIKEMNEMFDMLFGGKKYIQINLQSLASLLGESIVLPEFDSDELMDANTEKVLEAFVDAAEDLMADANIVAAFEKLVSDIKFMTASDTSFTIKITDKEFVEFVEGLIDIVDNNHEVVGNAAFDVMLVMSDLGYADMQISESDRAMFIEAFAGLKEEFSGSEGNIADAFKDVGFSIEVKFSVDENDDEFFDASAAFSAYDKSGANNKVAVTVEASVKPSSETVANISASDCMSFESLMVMLQGMSGVSGDEDMANDSYYGGSFDTESAYASSGMIF